MKSRNQYELDLMGKSGRIASNALKKAIEAIKVGVSEFEVDKITESEIYKTGGSLSYKTVPNYEFATCITVNEQVVHGIPTDRKFREGDLISVDLATAFKGWHTDCAWSIVLGKDEKKGQFLKAGEQALWEGIDQAVEGRSVGDISNAIQTRVEGAGYSVVRSLVGHGIGRNLHEDPQIPCFGKKGSGIKLQSGMTLAIEVIYTSGKADVMLDKDGWTFKTADGSWGGLFEMTVIVGPPAGRAGKRAEVLTDWRRV